MPFDSPDINLGHLLEDIGQGKIQLPDFQREWKWDVDRIGSLIASVSMGHPVGVVMMLEVGGEDVRFKPRVLAGVADGAAVKEPDQLILDGQQRLTSLYQSLKSKGVVDTFDSRGKRFGRWFYIDMATALDPEVDREDAVLAVPEDRVIRTNFGKDVLADFSTLDGEIQNEVFPLSRAFDMPSIFEWQGEYVKKSPLGESAASDRWNQFFTDVLNLIVQYTVPVIVLKKSTPKEAVCTVFEKVNTGGVALNVFELLTATFAADDFRLNDDWANRKRRLDIQPVLRNLESTDFLQAVSLVVTGRRRQQAMQSPAPGIPAVSCRRKDILKLALQDYCAVVDDVTTGFEWAAQFMSLQKIFRPQDVPYRTQLVPLAALRALVGAPLEQHGNSLKVQQWYWCGVLGELYGGAIETRFARDIEEVPAWLAGGPQPRTVADAAFEASRLLTMRTRNSAAYKGVYALLMREGCKDWIKNVDIDMAAFFALNIDIHHVFPRKWCDDHKIDVAHRDSIINKTPLAYDTNRIIGGRPPKSYLATVEARAGISAEAIDEILKKHVIDAEALRSDDFEMFFNGRKSALTSVISGAMGKEVVDEVQTGVGPDDYEETVIGVDQSDSEEQLVALGAW